MQGRDKRRIPKAEEIPMPKRSDFLRKLKKVAKAKPSTPRRRQLASLPATFPFHISPRTLILSPSSSTLTVAFPLSAAEQSKKKQPRQIR
jgi:hypothetical protein